MSLQETSIIERAARAGMSGAQAAEHFRAMDAEIRRLQPHNLWQAMIDATLLEAPPETQKAPAPGAKPRAGIGGSRVRENGSGRNFK